MNSSSILIVASNFPPIQSAGVYRTLRLAKYLPDRGWEIRVLTLCEDTLLQGTSTDAALLAQVPDSIQIFRAPARFPIETINRLLGRQKTTETGVSTHPGTAKKSGKRGDVSKLVQRLKDRVTLPWMTPDRLVGWVRNASKLGIKTLREEQADVIYSSGPPWSNHLVALRIKSATGRPWVADFRDPWVGNAFRPDRNGNTWAGRKHQALESEVYQKANAVIFNTDRSRDDAAARSGEFLAVKSVVIPNGFDPEQFTMDHGLSCDTAETPSSQPMRMIHTGAFYGKRNIDALLSALGQLKQEQRISATDLRLDLIGRVREHEKSLTAKHNIEDIVFFTPPIAHSECIQRLTEADVLLLVQTEAPLCIPGKLYEYIAIGKPILTLAADGATADMIARENLGICFAPEDVASLKAGLASLVDQHRKNELKRTHDSVRCRYDGREQMALYDSVLRQAMTGAKQISGERE